MIGGYRQSSTWNIDARYNKLELIRRIQKIAQYGHRISLSCEDAAVFIRRKLVKVPSRTLIYFDPPYFVKGGRLYDDHYKPADHAVIAQLVQKSVRPFWIVSYDGVPEILDLYRERRRSDYCLDYSAAGRSVGTEVMFFSDDLILPGQLTGGMQITLPLAA